MGHKRFYKITIKKLEFIAIVQGQSIKVGNPSIKQHPCVVMEVNNDNLDLSVVSFFPSCSLDMNMKKGQDGTIPMMRASIQFVLDTFPDIKAITLQDNSGFHYNNKHTIISTRNYLMYGKTWYQTNLLPIQLYPIGEANIKLIKKYDRILKDMSKYKDHFASDTDFKDSSSWFEYFQNKKTKMNDRVYPDLMEGILREIFKVPSLHGMPWKGDIPFGAKLVTEEDNYSFSRLKSVKMVVQWGGGNEIPNMYD
jgi:hypothetical protein